jgi:coproporphyrinogen III oxidase
MLLSNLCFTDLGIGVWLVFFGLGCFCEYYFYLKRKKKTIMNNGLFYKIQKQGYKDTYQKLVICMYMTKSWACKYANLLRVFK